MTSERTPDPNRDIYPDIAHVRGVWVSKGMLERLGTERFTKMGFDVSKTIRLHRWDGTKHPKTQEYELDYLIEYLQFLRSQFTKEGITPNVRLALLPSHDEPKSGLLALKVYLENDEQELAFYLAPRRID
jgi:hypothetical protein